jgi:antitoxin VapB
MLVKRTKTFKSGNSVAVRLPKSLGVEAGVEMTVREERGRYIVEPAERAPQRIDLTGIYGSGAGLRPLTDEEREIEPSIDTPAELRRNGRP